MTAEHPQKQWLSPENASAAKETAAVTLGSMGVKPFNIILQNLKVQKQKRPESPYREVVQSLYQEGGCRRFFNGLVPYVSRNVASSVISTPCFILARQAIQKKDLPLAASIAAISLSAALGETIATAPSEALELRNTTKGSIMPLSTRQAIQQGVKISPAILTRNSVYWLGIVAPDQLATKYDLSLPQQTALSYILGFSGGFISVFPDGIATRAFGSDKSLAQNVIETKNSIRSNAKTHGFVKAMQYGFAGSSIRGVQMGLFTVAANMALKYTQNDSPSERQR